MNHNPLSLLKKNNKIHETYVKRFIIKSKLIPYHIPDIPHELRCACIQNWVVDF